MHISSPWSAKRSEEMVLSTKASGLGGLIAECRPRAGKFQQPELKRLEAAIGLGEHFPWPRHQSSGPI